MFASFGDSYDLELPGQETIFEQWNMWSTTGTVNDKCCHSFSEPLKYFWPVCNWDFPRL